MPERSLLPEKIWMIMMRGGLDQPAMPSGEKKM